VLTVNPAPEAPSITTPPQSQTVTAGQDMTFSVTAKGTAPLWYQWYKDGAPISGATSSIYSITNVQASDAATYTVTISNGISPDATSSGAVLTVNTP
jgi:Immunoglobulin I-set domain.